MKRIVFFLLAASFIFAATSCNNKRSGKPRILVFSKTAEFRHSSIPNGKAAIQKLGLENGFDVDTTSAPQGRNVAGDLYACSYSFEHLRQQFSFHTFSFFRPQKGTKSTEFRTAS